MTLSVYRASALLAAALPFIAAGAARAQWLNYRTPGIPRRADGKPHLTAPAPHMADGKPDFTGVWQLESAGGKEIGKARESIRPQPWADALFKARMDNFDRDAPFYSCLPAGPMLEAPVGRILQTPAMLAMLSGGTSYREIFLDGRPLPEIVNPDWMGYSVGRWDGDTLVIESAGFNDKTWLDFAGHPHTEALHVTERLRRPDFGHLEIQKTFTDPGALLEPWTIPLKYELDADHEPLEVVYCENERDRQHFVGKASDETGIALAPGILSRYIGSYELRYPDSGRTDVLEIRLSDGQLTVSGIGVVPTTPLKALSETEFTMPFGVIVFVKDDREQVTHLILRAADGDVQARKR